MSDAFWAGGPQAYANGLEQERQKKLMALRKQVDSAADEAERSAVKEAMRVVQDDHEAKQKQIGRLLF